MKTHTKKVNLPWAEIAYMDCLLPDEIVKTVYFSKADAREKCNAKNIFPIVLSEDSSVTLVVYTNDEDVSFAQEILLDAENIIDARGFYIYE